MSILSVGTLRQIIEEASQETRATVDLPGLTLKRYTIHATKDWPSKWNKAEVYLFGVAGDGSGKVRAIPFGQAEVDTAGKNALLVREVERGATVEYVGAGLPLVLPPAQDFLAIRLLVADNDGTARDAAEVIKTVGETVATKEAIALLTLTGMAQAAAVAVVLGKALEAASVMMTKNKDDVIETFEGYFPASVMRRGSSFTVDNAGASGEFTFTE